MSNIEVGDRVHQRITTDRIGTVVSAHPAARFEGLILVKVLWDDTDVSEWHNLGELELISKP
jgi:hypothetical protein